MPARVDLKLGILGQGDADGVAQAVHEQRPDPYRRLHAAVLALPSLRHAVCYPPCIKSKDTTGLNY